MRIFDRRRSSPGDDALLLAPLDRRPAATDAQFKCEQNVDKAGAKFVAAKSKCISKCAVNAWKAIRTFSDCFHRMVGTPRSASRTACSVSGAGRSSRPRSTKSCDPTFEAGTECPTCYNSGDCSTSGYASDQVANIEVRWTASCPASCAKATGADPFSSGTKVPEHDGEALVKQVGGVVKCYDKCQRAARSSSFESVRSAGLGAVDRGVHHERSITKPY